METNQPAPLLSDEGGHSYLEYGLIIVLALMVISAVAALFLPTIRETLRERRQADAAANAVVSSVTERSTHSEVVEEEMYPVDNCKGRQVDATVLTRNRRIDYRIKLDKELDPPLRELVMLALQEKYAVVNKTQAERSYDIPLDTEPGQAALYVISWNTTWKTGSAQIDLGDGSRQVVGYEVSTALDPKVDSTVRTCTP